MIHDHVHERVVSTLYRGALRAYSPDRIPGSGSLRDLECDRCGTVDETTLTNPDGVCARCLAGEAA